MANPTLDIVAQAIADTAVQADSNLNGYPWLNPAPTTPAVCVNLETEMMERRTFREDMGGDWWRAWVLVDYIDSEESAINLLRYASSVGPLSIPEAFKPPTAAYRSVEGISQIVWHGFGRVSGEFQGPSPISFGGPDYWGVPLLFRAYIGYDR